MGMASNLEATILVKGPSLYWPLQDAVGMGITDLGVSAHAGVPGSNTTAAAVARDYLGSCRQFPGGNTVNDVIVGSWSPGNTGDQAMTVFFKFDVLDAVNARFMFYWGTWPTNGWGMYRQNNGHLILSGQPGLNVDTGHVVNDTNWHFIQLGWVGGQWGITLDGLYKLMAGAGWGAPSQASQLGGNTNYVTGAMQGRMAHMALFVGQQAAALASNDILGVSLNESFPTVGGAYNYASDLAAILAAVTYRAY